MSGESQTADTDSYEIKPFPEYSHTELLQQEKEVSGLYLSGHPLDAYRAQLDLYALAIEKRFAPKPVTYKGIYSFSLNRLLEVET